MGDVPYQERLRLFAGEASAAAGIGTWCFGDERQLFYSTCPNEKEFQMLLNLENGLDFSFARKGGCDRPVILSDSVNLIWAAENSYEGGKPALLIVMGPVFLNSTSVKNIEKALHRKNLSVPVMLQMRKLLENVPVVEMSTFFQYAVMMHYMLTEEKISPGDFIFQTDENLLGRQTVDEEDPDTDNLTQGEADADRTFQCEKVLLNAIRDGNKNYLKVLSDLGDFGGGMITDTGDALRDGKNTLLIFCNLCTRAGIEGGVSAKSAKELETRYANEIEKSTTFTGLVRLNDRLMEECVRKVNEYKENEKASSGVRACCDYIKVNLMKPLSVEFLARETGYTDYYFTKKFKKETGVSLTDYIKQARIEYAKILLITTQTGIDEISDSLHFGTRNYFSKIFREIVGITPAAYRERIRNGEGAVNQP